MNKLKFMNLKGSKNNENTSYYINTQEIVLYWFFIFLKFQVLKQSWMFNGFI